MFIYRLWSLRIPLVLFGFLIGSGCVYAFDPFTVAAVVGAGANAVSAVSETAGEVAASADAFTDLYNEIDSDSQVAEDGQRLVREIHDIENLAYEAGYTKEEVEQLTTDARGGKDGQKLSNTLKAITRAVRTGKRVARLVMKLEKKAQLAQVEQAATSREQLIALYKQIRIENERDLNAIKEKLKDLKEKRDQIATLKREEKQTGARIFGRTGVLTFPRQDSVIEEGIRMAIQMRPFLMQLLLFIFLAKVVFYQFGSSNSSQYGTLIRDTILCAFLLMVFPELVRASVTLCNDLAARVGLSELRDIEPGRQDFPAEIGLSIKPRIFLEWVFQWIKYIAFVTARFLANFGLAFLILMFPLVIFCSQMLGFSVAWTIFLGGFLAICLWPLFWNATGNIALMLWRKQDATISDQIATILFSLLQFISPLIGIACLKGQPLSKAVGGAVQAVKGVISSGVSTAAGLAMGAIGAKGGVGVGGTIGRSISYPVNQALGRSIAGGVRGIEAAKASRINALQGQDGTGAYRSAVITKVVKASAAGFITNQAQTPEKSGKLNFAMQTALSVRRKPILQDISGGRSEYREPSAAKDKKPKQKPVGVGRV